MVEYPALFDLHSKVALVTGGSRGLGRAAALGLAAAGAKVVIASRKQDACEKVVREIRERGGEALAHAAHVGQPEQLDALLDKTYEHFGRLDVLLNNAGISPAFAPLSETEEPLYDKIFAVNLRGPWYLASRAAPRMGADGGGSIINMISVGALRPGAGVGCYCASKAALEAFTRVMAQEWAHWKLRVNCLAPGPYRTDMLEGGIRNDPSFEEQARNSTALKRIADAEEIVGSVLYLACEASSFTTGQHLVSDGGFLAS